MDDHGSTTIATIMLLLVVTNVCSKFWFHVVIEEKREADLWYPLHESILEGIFVSTR